MNNQMQFRFSPEPHSSSNPIAFGEDDDGDDFSSRTKAGSSTPKYEEHNPNSRKEG